MDQLERKEFYNRFFTLALPILFQSLISTSLNFLDVFMVGQLGETALASVGIGNQVYFLFIMLIFGMASSSGIYAAQYWGQKDVASIRKFLGIGYILALGGTLIFTVGSLLFPEQVIGFFSKDQLVQHYGGEYLFIVARSYPMISICVMLGTVLRSTEEVKIPMVCGVIALGLNTLLNYLLIFGHWGLPQMGVAGAAWATVISRTVEVILYVALTYGGKKAPAAKLKELLAFTKADLKTYLDRAIPVILTNFLWAAGYSMYTMVYSRISTQSIAAFNVVGSVERISLMFFSAMGHASSTMVGNRIGAGEEKKAVNFGKTFLRIGLISALGFGIIIFLIRSLVVGLYDLEPLSQQYTRQLLLVMALGLWAKAGNIILLMGNLQAGGDTKYIMGIDVIGIWGIGVPLALVSAFVFHLPVPVVAAIILTEEVAKFTAAYLRYRSLKWINNLTDGKKEESVEVEVS